jgi:hypothetical protein
MTTTKEEIRTPAPGTERFEPLTEEHHEALRRSWELPAYARQVSPPPKRRRPIWVLASGLAAMVVGFGLGYLAGSAPVPPVPAEASTSSGYSVTHDSRIIEPAAALGYSVTHDSRIIEPAAAVGYSVTHDSRIIEPAGAAAAHSAAQDSLIIAANTPAIWRPSGGRP